MNTATLTSPVGATIRNDASTIGLVGLAHGTSHFHHMLLPPLFPVFMHEFALSYSQLGLLVTIFFAISGVGQALAGFAVDRFGARPMLWGAMCCFVGASVAAGLATGYGGLMLAAALAGLGNAPFHPADFTILNKRVSAARLGHAFSIHGISGNLGWALAPVVLIGVSSVTGHWRMAYVASGLLGLGTLLLLILGREAIEDAGADTVSSPHGPAGAASVDEHSLAFLKLPSVWLCFSFFFWTTAALSAIQSFASPALSRLYGLPIAATAFVVSGYMLCGAAGMVMGGFLVAKVQRLERIIAVAMAASALLLMVAAGNVLPGVGAAVVVALAGLGTGLAGPSRDMLIKRAAPPGATGRVYGTVYSGLDLGFALAAPIFGAFLDKGWPAAVLWGAAVVIWLGIGSASLVGMRVNRAQ